MTEDQCIALTRLRLTWHGYEVSGCVIGHLWWRRWRVRVRRMHGPTAGASYEAVHRSLATALASIVTILPETAEGGEA